VTTSKHGAPRPTGRIYRTLAALSAHTVESYWTVWGPGSQRPSAHRTAEDIALHA
jgi:hypothetical protein